MPHPGAGTLDLTSPKRVHFIGIGGAGMSAIAKVLVEAGFSVTGSDLKRSHLAMMLEAMGASVHIGHKADLVEDADVVVISAAIPEANVERREAQARGIPVISRGEALAAVLAGRRAIVVAGTHGKTTTTSMIVAIVNQAELDATYLVGAGLNDVGTNARLGHGAIAVAESDESDGSFLHLAPDVAVVTNVEADHLDHWGSVQDLDAAFTRFLQNVPESGGIVVPAPDDALCDAARATGRRVLTFGDGGDVSAAEVKGEAMSAAFDLVHEDRRTPVELRVGGAHNVANALAAAAACLDAGVDPGDIAAGLAAFRGVERRFQLRGEARRVTVVDDYAHHPTEVHATLSTARSGSWDRLVVVFQPHRYSRTAELATEFGPSFRCADRIVVTDVYGAGEQPVPGVSGKLIADSICRAIPGRPVAYLPHRDELLAYLESMARAGDVVLTLGAGDVTAVGEELLARLRGHV